jgi:hypothetical protein
MDKVDYLQARSDPRQSSFFGDNHTLELQAFYKMAWMDAEEYHPEDGEKILAVRQAAEGFRIEEMTGYDDGKDSQQFLDAGGEPTYDVVEWISLDELQLP